MFCALALSPKVCHCKITLLVEDIQYELACRHQAYVRFQVLTATSMKTVVFWLLSPVGWQTLTDITEMLSSFVEPGYLSQYSV
jgi:hypothetical protein